MSICMTSVISSYLLVFLSFTVGRLLEILDTLANPTVEDAAAEAKAEEIVEAVIDAIAEAEAAEPQSAEDAGIAGVPTAPSGMSFRFMQESELDNDPVSFENGAEWVDKEEAPADVVISVEITETAAPKETAEVCDLTVHAYSDCILNID